MFPKIGVFTPQIIHLFIRFSVIYKPSILGVWGTPYFWFNTQCVGLTKRPSSNFLGGDPAIGAATRHIKLRMVVCCWCEMNGWVRLRKPLSAFS